MTEIFYELFPGNFVERDFLDGYADYIRARNVFGRMEIAQTQLLPWIVRCLPDLADRRVLEIGCGTGSATAPLALASKHVTAFDIDEPVTHIARKRCALMDVHNVEILTRDTTWTSTFAETPDAICGTPIDVIVCYALFEHLLPLERIDLLVGAWKKLPIGGHLIVIETPNRLYPFDWHSSQLAFADQLPDEIAYLWYDFSERGSIPADIRASTRAAVRDCNRDQLYRFGRGASFHEFLVALGANAFRVLSSLDRTQLPSYSAENVETLRRQLEAVGIDIHPGFAFPSLDLVIEKTGSSRLQ